MGKAFIDRTGHKYGLLTVTSFAGKPDGKTKSTWACLCDCGNAVQVTGSNLATGHTESCGCLLIKEMYERRVYPKEVAEEYAIWRGIRQRTGAAPGKNAKWYSSVSMCPTWRQSFDAFLQDMGKRPSKLHSIERKDSLKGYEPGNCIWATAQEQANNRSTNHLLTFNGESMTLSQWSSRTGIKEHTIGARINRYGWTVEAALSTPTQGQQ